MTEKKIKLVCPICGGDKFIIDYNMTVYGKTYYNLYLLDEEINEEECNSEQYDSDFYEEIDRKKCIICDWELEEEKLISEEDFISKEKVKDILNDIK